MADLKTLMRAMACSLLLAFGARPAEAASQAFNGVQIGRSGDYAQDFELLDGQGRTHRLGDFRGRAVVLFFGYLQCPNYCPLALARMSEVMQLLGAEAQRVQVIFVTLDPERDTPAALREYVGNFHPSFLGLHTTPEATPSLALQFRVYYRRVPGTTPGAYHIDHAVFSYAYDPAGRLRLRLSDSLSAAEIAADLKRLLSAN